MELDNYLLQHSPESPINKEPGPEYRIEWYKFLPDDNGFEVGLEWITGMRDSGRWFPGVVFVPDVFDVQAPEFHMKLTREIDLLLMERESAIFVA